MSKKPQTKERYTVVLKEEHAEALRDLAWSQGLRVEDMIEVSVDSFLKYKGELGDD